MERYTITIGSNETDKIRLVEQALEWLGSWIRIVCATAPYVAPDSSGKTSLEYANIVAKIETPLAQGELDCRFKAYEKAMGRVPGSDSVLIDIDIVCHDEEILRPDDYSSPHFREGLLLLHP